MLQGSRINTGRARLSFYALENMPAWFNKVLLLIPCHNRLSTYHKDCELLHLTNFWWCYQIYSQSTSYRRLRKLRWPFWRETYGLSLLWLVSQWSTTKKTFRWSARKRAYVIIGFPEKSKKNMSFLTKDSQFQARVQIVGVAQAKVSKRGEKRGRGRKGRALGLEEGGWESASGSLLFLSFSLSPTLFLFFFISSLLSTIWTPGTGLRKTDSLCHVSLQEGSLLRVWGNVLAVGPPMGYHQNNFPRIRTTG